MEQSLIGIGVARHAAAALVSAVSRPCGMVVLCGPAGAGKTTVGQLISAAQTRPIVWLGDLRMPDEIGAALVRAEHEPVVIVVRSGESSRLRGRWSDMKLANGLVDRASVVTVTLRRLARASTAGVAFSSTPTLPDLLVLEVLAPDGTAVTESLVNEARALVAAGLTTAIEARLSVPDYI